MNEFWLHMNEWNTYDIMKYLVVENICFNNFSEIQNEMFKIINTVCSKFWLSNHGKKLQPWKYVL